MKKVIISALSIVLILLLGYGFGIYHYAEKFQPNTKIGQVDVSNMTLAEAKEAVEQNLVNQEVEITENGKSLGKFAMKDLNPKLDTIDQLQKIYNAQNPNLWLFSYFKGQHFDGDTLKNIDIDDKVLNQALLKAGLDNSERTPASDATIDYNESKGYYVVDAKEGNQVDLTQLKEAIASQLQDGQQKIEVNQYYMQPTLTADDESIQNTMKQIDEATSTKITLTIDGHDEVIPQKEIEKWIYFDGSNQIVYDETLIQEFLKTYNDQYATFLKERTFKSTLRGEVTVQPGTLGWSIDREAEAAQIAQDLYKGEDVKRDPAIAGTGYGNNGNDIGDTYVEIDVLNQTMFIYKDGQEVLQTPIVTGQIGTDTVPGAYSVWDKEENAELKGYNPRTQRDYVQPVAYWMPFDDTGQGIHDANWQSNFGGNTYQVSGSLGCINTPPDIMPEVFAAVELGTPVIVFE